MSTPRSMRMAALALGLIAAGCASSPATGDSISVANPANGEDQRPQRVPPDAADADRESIADARAIIERSYDAMYDGYDNPYDMASSPGVDLIGFGTVVDVVEGRRSRHPTSPQQATTFVVEADKLLKGNSGESRLVYLEVFHSQLVASDDLSSRILPGQRLFFAANDSTSWAPKFGIDNKAGGRVAGSTDPIYAAMAEGFIFLTDPPLSFVGSSLDTLPGAWSILQTMTPTQAEDYLLKAMASPQPYVVLGECADLGFVLEGGLSGISAELNAEIRSLIEADDCIDQQEINAFWERYPEMSAARLGG